MDSIIFNGIRYEWLGQSAMRISSSGKTVYTDPVYLDGNAPPATHILLTHHHVDHCLPEYITPIRAEGTKVAAFHESYLKYCVHDIKGVRTIKVGQTVDLSGISVTGVEAYASRGFHMKGEGCGFIIEMDGQRIYFAGDTARIPEMAALGSIDVAMLPISDNAYAIDFNDMIEAVKEIRPGLFIPVHYTPMDEEEPKLEGAVLLSKDPRFFTKRIDPLKALPLLEGTGTEMAVLKKLGRTR